MWRRFRDCWKVPRLWEISLVISQSEARVRLGEGSGYGMLVAMQVSKPWLSVIILISHEGVTVQNSKRRKRKQETDRNLYPSA
jgi:hypothetical protein